MDSMFPNSTGNALRLLQPPIFRVFTDLKLQMLFGRLLKLTQPCKLKETRQVKFPIDMWTSSRLSQYSRFKVSRNGKLLKSGVVVKCRECFMFRVFNFSKTCRTCKMIAIRRNEIDLEYNFIYARKSLRVTYHVWLPRCSYFTEKQLKDNKFFRVKIKW